MLIQDCVAKLWVTSNCDITVQVQYYFYINSQLFFSKFQGKFPGNTNTDFMAGQKVQTLNNFDENRSQPVQKVYLQCSKTKMPDR